MSENVTTQFDEFDDDNKKKNIQDQIKNTSLEDMEENDKNVTDNDGLTDEEKREIEKKKRLSQNNDEDFKEEEKTNNNAKNKTEESNKEDSSGKTGFSFFNERDTTKTNKSKIESNNSNPAGVTEMKQTGKEGVVNKKFKTIGIFLLGMIIIATLLSLGIKSCTSDKVEEVTPQQQEQQDSMQEVEMFRNNASTDTLNNVNVNGQSKNFEENINQPLENPNSEVVDRKSLIVSYTRGEDGKVYGLDKDGNIVLDENGNPLVINQDEYNSTDNIDKQEQESLEKLNKMESELLGKREGDLENLDDNISLENVKKEKVPNTTPLHEGAGAAIKAYGGTMQDRLAYLSAKVQKEEAMQQLKEANNNLVKNKKNGGIGINYKANKVDGVAADIFGTDDTGVQFSAGANAKNGTRTNTTPYYAYEKEEGKYDIFEGTIIPAVIQNQINSDYKGRVLALVREDVYDSLTGEVLLIPKGSRILGEMLPLNTFGGLERIVTVWDRIILPNGDNIFMENFRGQDLTGIDGIEGKVNKRYFKKISSIVLASVFEGTIGIMSTLPEIMLRKHDKRDGVIYSDSGATAGRRIGDNLTEIVDTEVGKIVSRPNTVTLPSGTKTNIVVQIDIKLPKFERVR